MKAPSFASAQFILSLIFLIVVSFNLSCKKPLQYSSEKSESVPKSSGGESASFDGNQVVVWLKPGSSYQWFRDTINKICIDDSLTPVFCANCDSTLALLTGPGAAGIFGSVAQGATGGSTGTGSGPTGGGGDGFYWFVNFNMEITDRIIGEKKIKEQSSNVSASDFKGSPVVVGVLDSGVDPEDLARTGFLFDGSQLPVSCLDINATNGWNFPAWNNNINDDYKPDDGHGSNVAALIKEEGIRIKDAPIKILPVKVIPARGRATLYHFLCGIVYAKNRGAKIINASLGYYPCLKTVPDSGSIIF